MFTFKNETDFDEFEISGSTYEPIGDVFHGGKKVKGSDFLGLEELAVISVMCNDSAIDFNEYKNAFEKVNWILWLIFPFLRTVYVLKIPSKNCNYNDVNILFSKILIEKVDFKLIIE